VAWNRAEYLVTLGFVVYAFEGIGVVMPIMQTCATPEKFNRILIAGVGTLTVIYIAFGTLCYFTYGAGMNEPLITEMLPASDTLVIFTKMVYIVNLLCSYALTICPTNRIIEEWLFKKGDNSTTNYWMKNTSRALVAISACFFGVKLAAKIDKFLGLMGALLCAPLALLFPTFCHLKLMAKT
jgi:solute carrier family 36 (proton-coupled amino acid transporter)